MKHLKQPMLLAAVLLFVIAGTAMANQIVIMPDSVRLEAGQGIQFRAQLFNDNGEIRRVPLDEYRWKLVPETLGDISDDGYLIGGRLPGRGKVVAALTIDGVPVIGEADVWVGASVRPEIELMIRPQQRIAQPGDTLKYTAFAVTSTNRNVQIDHVRWLVLPNNMATIDQRGVLVAGKNYGEGVVVAIAEIAGRPFRAESRLIIAPQPNAAIAGIVTSDEDGSGIANAKVSAYRVGKYRWHRSVMTDTDGNYVLGRLIPGVYVVRTEARGFIPEWYDDATQYINANPVTLAEAETLTVNVGLSAGSAIAGEVVAELDGTPLENAQVVAYLVLDPTIKIHTLTGEDGSYEIGGLISGSYIVHADKPGYSGEYFDNVLSARDAEMIEVNEPETVSDINFGLNLATAITGIVIDAKSGDPIGGAQVYTLDQRSATGRAYVTETRTNRNGEYVLQLQNAGNFIVAANAEGYTGEYYKDASDYMSATYVRVDSGVHVNDINFDLAKHGVMSGLVTDQISGEPIANALVEAFCAVRRTDTISAYRAKTDSDGVFTIENMIAGKYLVTSSARGYLPEYYEEAAVRSDAELVPVQDSTFTGRINFTLETGGAISGVVLSDKDNQPLANAKIVVQQVHSSFSAHAYTLDDGSYKISGLLDGKYLVWANARGHIAMFYDGVLSRQNATMVDVASPKVTTDINFVLPIKQNRDGVIAGMVTEDMGDVTNIRPEPIHGAWVLAMPVGRGIPVWTVTEEDGSYKLTNLKAGAYYVAAWARGYIGEFYDDVRHWRFAKIIQIRQDQVIENINFDLAPQADGAYSITGIIISDEQEELGDVMVYAVTEAGVAGCTMSDVDGSYIISGLNPGDYKIEVVSVELDESYYGGFDETSAKAVAVGELSNASDINITVSTLTTAIDEAASALPTTFGIEQNYPNPFNPTTEIAFSLPASARVTLRVYNLLGQEVRTLLNGTLNTGHQTIEWDGKNNLGVNVTSGIYIYHLTAQGANGDQFHRTMKMTLMR